MRSRILGQVPLAPALLAPELSKILDVQVRDQYSEYTFGTWRSYVLANGSGDGADTSFRGYEGRPRKTPLGASLPYLARLIAESFDTEHLKWERIFLVQNGLLVSHRDFVEFKEPFVRLNLPLATDPSCLHSEEDQVFHMRQGEVWFLDAHTVHSACSLSDFCRLSLCLDFADDGRPLEEWLRPEHRNDGSLTPALVEREPLSETFREGLLGLGAALSRENFRDLIGLLAKVHFYRQAHAAELFDWLVEIARRSADPELLRSALGFRRYCIEAREWGERFPFPTPLGREVAA